MGTSIKECAKYIKKQVVGKERQCGRLGGCLSSGAGGWCCSSSSSSSCRGGLEGRQLLKDAKRAGR